MPYAGYGMNAGIADATNLAWLLAATLDGWASPDILDAYEAERLPITEQVSHFAMDMALKVLGPAAHACRPRSSWPGPEGDAVRAAHRPGGLRPQRAAVLLRRPQLRLLLRPLADHPLRRRRAAGLHHGRIHALHRAGLSHSARLAARWLARSTTLWGRATRCFASTRRFAWRRSMRPPGHAACRSRSSMWTQRPELRPEACPGAYRSAHRVARRRVT